MPANLNLWSILPALSLSLLAAVLLLMTLTLRRVKPVHSAAISCASLLLGGVLAACHWNDAQSGFAGRVLFDNFAIFISLICVASGIMTIALADNYFSREQESGTTCYALIVFTVAGAMWMVSATDLLTIFLGFEMMTIALYVLVGYFRRRGGSLEAGLKYFILGSFSSAFLLYGIALIYGVSGSTRIELIAEHVQSNTAVSSDAMFVAGALLLLIGLLFRIAIVPFHMWLPDVCQGAPTPVAAFMCSGPAVAAFAVFLRVTQLALVGMQDGLMTLLWILAVMTMVVGNFVAITQSDLRRILTWSFIAHSGYAMVGVVAWTEIGTAAVLFYLLICSLMHIGVYAALMLIAHKGEQNLTLDGVAGMGYRKPALAIVLTLQLLSLMGVPLTAGFIGKFYLFAGAIQAGYLVLAIIALLNCAVSLYCYLRVIVHMYFKPPQQDFDWISMHWPTMVVILISIAAVFALGLIPGPFMALAGMAGI